MPVIKLPAAGQLFEFDSDWINDPSLAEAEDIEIRSNMRFPEFVEGLMIARTRCIAVAVWLAMFRAGYQQADEQPGEDGSRGTHLITFDDVLSGRVDVRLSQVYEAIGKLADSDKPEERPPGPTRARERHTDPAGSATTPSATPPSSPRSTTSGRGSSGS